MTTKPKSPFDRIPRLTSWATVQQGLLLFIASSGGSFLNFLYHFLIGRLLGPEQYAALAALIGVLNSVSAPANLSQLIMSDMTARLLAMNQPGQVKSLIVRLTGGLLIIGVVGVLILTVVKQVVSQWMNLASDSGVVVLAFAFASAILAPVFIGCLQGRQEFRGLSMATLISGLLRLSVGVALVWAGFGVNGALSGFIAASAGLVCIAMITLRTSLSVQSTPIVLSVKSIARFSLQATFATVAFAVLTSSDVVFARRFFTSEIAGHYSAAATLGKVVLFLPGPVATLMFPKSSARHVAGVARGPVLLKGALATIGLSLAVVIVFLGWPGLIIQLLYGPAFAQAAQWLGVYGLAAMGMALVQLFMLHYLAAHDPRFTWLLCGFAIAQLAILNFLSLAQTDTWQS